MNEKEDGAKVNRDPRIDTCACRQSAQGVLRDNHERQEKRTQAVETLLRVIPWQLLSQHDEETLYWYFSERR
jgi:hypothetical protein